MNFTPQDVERFLQDSIFQHFLTELKDAAIREWIASIHRDDRERLHMRMRVLQEFDSFCRSRLIVKPEKIETDY